MKISPFVLATSVLLLLFFTQCQSSQPDFSNIDKTTFQELSQQPEAVILDVRTPGETSEGMIEGAIAIDVLAEDFSEKVEALDTSKTYLVYCRSGSRSQTACGLMSEKGFKNLYNLRGGYLEWTKE